MDFDRIETIAKLEQALRKPLPGHAAHSKIVSYARPSIEEAMNKYKNPKQSAVLVLLYPKNDQLHTLLMLRTAYEGVHSAQISFPGGRKEDHDPDLEATALRETSEETGIMTDNIKMLGQLSEVYIPPSDFLVSPFVAYSEKPGTFHPDPLEVDELIETSLDHLMDDTNIKQKEIFVRMINSKVKAKYFDVNGHVVWGATAMMISELREVLRAL